jgi:aryl-alcohol dehydrogenase-like predicted oxidoreductase
MKYKNIGRWGAKLSVIGLGSYLTIGYKVDDKTSRDTVQTAYDAGVNFFDTADAYNKGEGELALGKCLKDLKRSTYFLLTKCWAPMSDDVNDRGLSAKHIFESCHASLSRLGTDYLDCLMCHRPDPDTPLDETVRALEDLARQGKILYWGVSEWPAHDIARANGIAKDIGARACAISEPRYNLFYRYPERNLFPTTLEEGMGNVVFSALAHGMLTGKYKPGEPAPSGTRAESKDTNTVMMKMYWNEAYKEKAQVFSALAREMGISAAQLAIAWCLANPAVTSVISAATKISQLEDNLAAADVVIPNDVMVKIDELFPTPEAVESEH